jgi:hypothetical protein
MATRIQVDGTKTEITGEKPDGKLTLAQMQEAVGGLIQPVYLSGSKLVLVDEEGLLKQSAYNSVASNLTGQYVVGDALLMDDSEWE